MSSAVAGYGQESDRRRTREAGFHHHRVKPVDIDAIESTLMAPGSQNTDSFSPFVRSS
jgi:hypothetical protein